MQQALDRLEDQGFLFSPITHKLQRMYSIVFIKKGIFFDSLNGKSYFQPFCRTNRRQMNLLYASSVRPMEKYM